jgi:hypothetical protein
MDCPVDDAALRKRFERLEEKLARGSALRLIVT